MGNDLSSTDFFSRSLTFVRLDRILRPSSNGMRRYRSGTISGRKTRTASVTSTHDARPLQQPSHSASTTPTSPDPQGKVDKSVAASSVRRSKSWRCSPTVPNPNRHHHFRSTDSSSGKSSPGEPKHILSPDLQLNDDAYDEFDGFFQLATSRLHSSESPPPQESPSGRVQRQSSGDAAAVVGANVYDGHRLFLRVPSPTSDELSSSTHSARSNVDSLATSDDQQQSEVLPAKVRPTTSSLSSSRISRKSSSFRRPSVANGATVRFADDNKKMSTSTPTTSMEQHQTSSSNPNVAAEPGNAKGSPPKLTSVPSVRSLKSSASVTELQKKRRADVRRKTIAATSAVDDANSATASGNMKDSKSPSASRINNSAPAVMLLTPAQITLIRQHWNQTYGTKGPTVVGNHIFQRACFKVPAMKEIFNHADFTEKFPNMDLVYKQHAKNVALLIDDIVQHLDQLESIIPKLREIGRKHAAFHAYGLQASYWAVFAESFIDCTLEWGEKIRRVEEARKAWAILISYIVDRMKVGFQDGKRDINRVKICGGESSMSDGCGSPPR